MARGPEAAVAIQLAGDVVRRASRFTHILSWLLPARSRPFFCAWYAYLRWVDDTVDDVTASQQVRRDLLERQLRLVDDLYEGKAPNLSREEAILAALVDYDTGRGRRLREPLSKMLAAMRFDVERQGRVSGYADLRRNFDHEVVSYLYTIGYFCELPDQSPTPPGAQAANAAKTAHILRDFLGDCDEHQVNISQEELESYGLALPAIRSEIVSSNGRQWVAANVRIAERELQSGLRDAANAGSIRYSLIVGILVAKYRTYLDQIRRDDFVLNQKLAFRGWSFAANLLLNAAVLIGRRNPARRSAAGGVPDPLLPLSRLEWFLLRMRMLPFCNRKVVAGLDRALEGLAIPNGDLRKLRRRFVVAYWLGRSSCAAIAPSLDADHSSRVHCAGLVYACWSLAVLELDSLIDEEGLSRSAAQTMVAAWLDQVREVLDGGRQTGPSDLRPTEAAGARDERFQRLARAFREALRGYLDRLPGNAVLEEPSTSFLAEAQTFLQAQIDSLDQKAVDHRHDWNWYATTLLNQKTLGFALAPLALWRSNHESEARRGSLQRAFVELNAGYCHWQLLDDLADIRNDTVEGRVTTPGFILLSQGALARRYLAAPNVHGGGDGPALVGAVRQSKLLEGRFLTSPLSDGFRHLIGGKSSDAAAAVEALVHCALINDDGDRRASLKDLANARAHHAGSYLLAMRSGDFDGACRILAESRVANRILAAVADDVARIEARERLRSVADRPSLMMLHIIEMLIRHCYRKAGRSSNQTGEAATRLPEAERRLFPAE